MKPILEFFGAAFRDLDQKGGPVTVTIGAGPEAEDGWSWVEKGGHEVQGGQRVGWKVLDEGEVHGAGQSGVLQGL